MGIAETEERTELETLVEVLGNDEAQHAAEEHDLYHLVESVQHGDGVAA